MTTVRANSILVVEDDKNAGILLRSLLVGEGYDVTVCTRAKTAIQAFLTNTFDICILDCGLPDADGFSLARDIRTRNSDVPIVFLTAKSMLDDKIKGFQSGADDYMTKPFETFELLYKIKAILRRTASPRNGKTETVFQIGLYTFDAKNQTLTIGMNQRRITAKETEILRMLCLSKNQITRKEDMLIALWGESDYFKGRSLDVFIARLRKYLSDDSAVRIENVHRVGFILSETITA